jgi:hypothetical protein
LLWLYLYALDRVGSSRETVYKRQSEGQEEQTATG